MDVSFKPTYANRTKANASDSFTLEGLLTVLLSLTLPFLLYDHPEKARFLAAEERAFHVKRLQIDYSNGAKDQTTFKWK